jgi:hypothetical protein
MERNKEGAVAGKGVVIRRNLGAVLTAVAVIGLLLVAFILALAQDKLPELGLDLLVYLFAITLAVFVVERMLAWREERRWLAAKNWLYMILLETIDDLLKELLPAKVPTTNNGNDDYSSSSSSNEGEEIAVYEVDAERIHFGEVVAYTPLRLLVSPAQRELQSHIRWYVERVGAPRYAEVAREALSDSREQIRDMFGSSARLMDAEITAMLISFEQAALAAIRHLDSAMSLQEKKKKKKKKEGGGGEGSAKEEADQQLAFAVSIIVESVVDSAIKPKRWLEEEIYSHREEEGGGGGRAGGVGASLPFSVV